MNALNLLLVSTKKNHNYVDFIEKYIQDSDGDKLPKFKRKYFTKKHVARYSNCRHKLAKLSRCAYLFLSFITEEMDSKNNIVHTKQLRTKFITHMNKDCNASFKDDTVKKAFYQLIDEGLIIDYGVKQDYTVNPLHFFSGTEEKRKILIKELLRHMRTAKSNSNIRMALAE